MTLVSKLIDTFSTEEEMLQNLKGKPYRSETIGTNHYLPINNRPEYLLYKTTEAKSKQSPH